MLTSRARAESDTRLDAMRASRGPLQLLLLHLTRGRLEGTRVTRTKQCTSTPSSTAAHHPARRTLLAAERPSRWLSFPPRRRAHRRTFEPSTLSAHAQLQEDRSGSKLASKSTRVHHGVSAGSAAGVRSRPVEPIRQPAGTRRDPAAIAACG